jgi:hypothetical protein
MGNLIVSFVLTWFLLSCSDAGTGRDMSGLRGNGRYRKEEKQERQSRGN